ncbi:MAG: Gfo/Idh/MocA family oxidoreductase [Candidatus Eremiobacteraeota bacterium]|nr:Gfo/Idh/MocA family oxidoreductase [Candidatus Eremiobacteraeota bacterium]
MSERAARPLGIGFVGAGMVGQFAHMASFARIAGVRLVALAEIRPRLRAAVAERYEIPHAYATHAEMLEDRAVQAVVVVTRRPATGPVVYDALCAGKHVLSEKPMAYTLEQGERLVAEAEKRKLRYAIGFMKRHDVGVEEAVRAVGRARDSAGYGALVAVRAYGRGGATEVPADAEVLMTNEPRPDGIVVWPIGPSWLPPVYAGQYDKFLNVHSHLVNLVRLYVGEPAIRVARIDDPNEGTIEAVTAGGVPCTFEFAYGTEGVWTEGIEFTFERGRISLELPAPFRAGGAATIVLESAGARRAVRTFPGVSWAFERQAQAFADDVRERREPLASGRDSLGDLRFTEAAWRATLEAAVP